MSRARYTSTRASLDTLLVPLRVQVGVDRGGDARWAFAANASRESFGDDNPITTMYAWLLAPLSASPRHRVRAGYAISYQDAAHSRWQADPTRASGGTPGTVRGRYAPYYSPHDVRTHGALAEGAVALGTAWLLLNANVGVHATETAPVLQQHGAPVEPPVLTFYRRSFRPAEASIALALPAGHHSWLRLEARHQRTAYYRASDIALSMMRQFGTQR
jgi:hypothetical protein